MNISYNKSDYAAIYCNISRTFAVPDASHACLCC